MYYFGHQKKLNAAKKVVMTLEKRRHSVWQAWNRIRTQSNGRFATLSAETPTPRVRKYSSTPKAAATAVRGELERARYAENKYSARSDWVHLAKFDLSLAEMLACEATNLLIGRVFAVGSIVSIISVYLRIYVYQCKWLFFMPDSDSYQHLAQLAFQYHNKLFLRQWWWIK